MNVQLNKRGYEPFIDFLKGFAILCVVVTHATPKEIKDGLLFCFWGDWAVPLFILIQVFHTYKKGKPSLSYPWKKMIRRILLPFVGITSVIFILNYLWFESNLSLISSVRGTLIAGGIGPGSYYPWLYMQFFILLPILYGICNKGKISIGVFLIIAVLLEILCSLVHIPEYIYRLSFLRYFFLIYLGYRWVENGVEINKTTIFLSVLSLIFIGIFNYTKYDFEPIFFKTNWKIYHWICYFFPAFILVFLLKFCYNHFSYKFKQFVTLCGKYSFEIFLWQMLIFTFYPSISEIVRTNLAIEESIITVILDIFLGIILSLLALPVMSLVKSKQKNYKLCKNSHFE